MDVFTRAIRGWCLSRFLDVTMSLRTLEMILAEHMPEIHRNDQGVQYSTSKFVKVLKTYQVQFSMAAVGEPDQNGYGERLMRTIKEEEVDLSDFRAFSARKAKLGNFSWMWIIESTYIRRLGI